ncbi:MAG: tyrosine-type recombinase/integrase [Flavobacteriales bacterium]|nr:tyrosine-type recombinase/integrase [Flavobacteriales bacterium]
MATVNFLYRSTKPKANLILRLLFRENSIDYVFGAKTKFEVDKLYWTKHHNLKRVKDIEISNKQLKVNEALNKIENHVLKAFDSVDVSEVSKEWLQNQINCYYNPKKQTTLPNKLTDYIEYYKECKKFNLSSASITKFNTIKSKIEDLELTLNKTILISDVNESFKNEFVEYYKLNKYSTNTIQRELSFIKTFCRHARSNGVETSTQLDSLVLQKAKVEKIYLTFAELDQIQKADIKNEALQNARDWLIISCYTGQRVSDFLRFTKDMIRIEDGINLIEFTQKKTGKKMSLALHPKVIEILKKNKGNFPYAISDQRYNEHIKEVCKEAKITTKVQGGKNDPETNRKVSGIYSKHELVSSHIGRRSFATNFYGKIPTSLLISATGHSSEGLFLEYIGKTQTQQAKELANYY